MKKQKGGPFPACEFCECTHETGETLGCAAEKLRKSLWELAAALPVLRRMVPEDGIGCGHFVMSVYSLREEKMNELSALTGREFAKRIRRLICAEYNTYGHGFEMELWELAIGSAKSGMNRMNIVKHVEWAMFRKMVTEDGI